MRSKFGRLVSAAVLTGAALLAMSGCSRVDLVNEWPAMAAPTGWEPESGVCTSNFAETSYRSAYSPRSCAEAHSYETVHIGDFTGDAAALPKPPAVGSAALTAAWGECDAKTTEYLGGPWRDAKIWIAVSVPSAGNWEGGARWFRCEVAATGEQFGDRVSWSASLKGELARDSKLRNGCYVVPKEEDARWDEVECAAQHNGEYVGSFISTDTRDGLLKDKNAIHRKCLSLIAVYVGVPDDGMMKYRSGTGYLVPSPRLWESGDHGVRCYLYLGKMKTGSLKGAGTKGLPINYA